MLSAYMAIFGLQTFNYFIACQSEAQANIHRADSAQTVVETTLEESPAVNGKFIEISRITRNVFA